MEEIDWCVRRTQTQLPKHRPACIYIRTYVVLLYACMHARVQARTQSHRTRTLWVWSLAQKLRAHTIYPTHFVTAPANLWMSPSCRAVSSASIKLSKESLPPVSAQIKQRHKYVRTYVPTLHTEEYGKPLC